MTTTFLGNKEQWRYPARAFYPITFVEGEGLLVGGVPIVLVHAD